MERDEIIRMAREAGFRSGHITLHSLQRFAALVEAAATEKANERADRTLHQVREAMHMIY